MPLQFFFSSNENASSAGTKAVDRRACATPILTDHNAQHTVRYGAVLAVCGVLQKNDVEFFSVHCSAVKYVPMHAASFAWLWWSGG